MGFSNAMRSSSAACSRGYSLKNARTHRVLTVLPLGRGTSSRGRLQAWASRAHPLDQLSFRVDGKPGRNDEVADGPKRSAELTVSACLIGRPFAEEYARIGDLVCVVDGIGNVLHEFLLVSIPRPEGNSRNATGI